MTSLETGKREAKVEGDFERKKRESNAPFVTSSTTTSKKAESGDNQRDCFLL